MRHWLFPANIKFYDVLGAFNGVQTYWPAKAKVSVGDAAFIYLAAPYQQIGFVCKVLETGLDPQAVLEQVRPFFIKIPGKGNTPKTFIKLRIITKVPLDPESLLSYHRLKQNG